jgi:predicted DNA-binding protein YlxM (UPF0122 family)
MAGRPIRKDTNKRVEELFGSWDNLIEHIADGASLQELADQLDISRSRLSNQIRHQVPDHRLRLEEARRQRADAYADEAREIADGDMLDQDGNISGAAVSRARLRVDTRKWLAAVDNPEKYGKQDAAQVNVNLTVNQLHLDALRHFNQDRRAVAKELDAQ